MINIPILITIIYVILTLTGFTVQFILANLHFFKQQSEKKDNQNYVENLLSNGQFPAVSVVYPIYNESPEVLERVLQTASKCLEIPNLELIFVDDGSPNINEVRPIYEKYRNNALKIFYKTNGGKREAQYFGFGESVGEYIITVDSDTLIYKKGILTLITPMLRDPKIGAVTGDIRVKNRDTNLLTILISIRYWLAFNLERAAQSFTGSMLCCSGPFSVYRKSTIDKIKEKYISQMFFGKKCTYGDDRHLTNLILNEDFKTIYQIGAIADTFVPTKMSEYITQQTRWNKSFYRELFWTLKAWNKISFYSLWDSLLQPFLFLFFTMTLGVNLFNFLNTLDFKVFLYYLSLVVIMASVRGVYGLIRTFDPRFLLFIFYGFIHLLILIPIRFKALMTLSDNGWGTRGTKKTNVWLDYFKWLGFYTFIVLILTWMVSLLLPDTIWMNLQKPTFQNNASFGNFLEEVSISWSSAFFPLTAVTILFSLLSVLQNFRISNLSFKLQSLVLLFAIFVGVGYTVSTYSTSLSNNRRWAQVNQDRGQVAGVQEKNNENKPNKLTANNLTKNNSSNSNSSILNSQNATSNATSTSTSTIFSSAKSSTTNSFSDFNSSQNISQNSIQAKTPTNEISNSTKEEIPKIYTAIAKKGDSSTVLVRQIIKDYHQKINQIPNKGLALFVENNLTAEQKPNLEIGDKIEINHAKIEAKFENAKKLESQNLKMWEILATNVGY